MTRIPPLFLLLLLVAGCATAGGPLDTETAFGSQPIVVQVYQTEPNAYELAASYPGLIWMLSTPSKKETSEAIQTKAAALCAPGSIETLDDSRPDYILVKLTPRIYLHCR